MFCHECEVANKMKEKLLEESDSVFDAVYDYQKFIEECQKNCKMENKNES